MPLFAGVRSVLGGLWRSIWSVIGSSTSDEIKPLNVSAVTDRLDPATDDLVTVELALQPARRNDGDGWPFEPSAVVLGAAEAFEVRADEGVVAVADGFADGVARPAEVADFENPHAHGKLMDFRLADLDIPDESVFDGELALGVGVFPHGPTESIPRERWDTTTVRIPPHGHDN